MWWLWCGMWLVLLFFFKQKTAYEVRISDWSSDVCSSDLLRVTLAVAMIWNPVAVLATYALLGVGVMVSRWIAPMPVAAALAPVAPSVDDQPDTVEFAEAA